MILISCPNEKKKTVGALKFYGRWKRVSNIVQYAKWHHIEYFTLLGSGLGIVNSADNPDVAKGMTRNNKGTTHLQNLIVKVEDTSISSMNTFWGWIPLIRYS